MKKRWVGLAGVLGAVVAASAAGQTAVTDVSVCDVVNHPLKYDGKTVRMKGTVQVGVDSFVVRGDTCDSSLWLSYPAGTKAKAGPAAVLTLQLASNASGTPGTARGAVTLDRNKDFEQFDALLSQKVKTPGLCLGCVKNNVTATLTGRVDGTENAGLARDSAGKITGLDGFGNLNAYAARLVLESVAEVKAEEIDFSKAPKVKDDGQGSGDKDYVGLTRKAEDAFPKGSETSGQIERALAAYGGPGVDNGVVVAFGQTADVPDGEGTKGAKNSPDGLLLLVRFDTDRLKGESLSLAAAHEGAEIASLREPGGKSFPAIEQQAWQTLLVTLIGSRQKTLTLPGGGVMWDESWAQADRTNNASAALRTYLVDREQGPR